MVEPPKDSLLRAGSQSQNAAPDVKKNWLCAAALLTTTVRDRVPGHTNKGAAGCASETALVGFELETNWFQSYIVANYATM